MVSKIKRWFTFENVLIVCGLIGLYASTILTLEMIHILKNPDASLSCDINPIISCSSVIDTPQGSLFFDIPNPIFGIISFSAIITIGVAIKAGAEFKKWFWQGLQGGVVFGILFTHWLIIQSIFNLKVLCPYCMAAWTIMIPLFVYITRYNLHKKYIANPFGNVLYQLKAYEVVILWYLVIIITILYEFWYYWQTIAPFNFFN